MPRSVSVDPYKNLIFFDLIDDKNQLDSKIKRTKDEPENYDGYTKKYKLESVGPENSLSLDLVLSGVVSNSGLFINQGQEGYVLIYDYENKKAYLYDVLNEIAGQSRNIRLHVNAFFSKTGELAAEEIEL